MKYFIILIFFLSFSANSKGVTIVCNLDKVIINGNERNFSPTKRFLKYKDSVVTKRNIMQKFDGEWFCIIKK